MTITFDRLTTNYGTREGSVRWFFEDFAYDETLFGSVMIRFTTNMEDDGRVNGDLKIVDFEVEFAFVHDDDGNDITPLTDAMAMDELRAIAAKHFEGIKDHVEDQLRFGFLFS
jgi:hypothetical protein